MKIEVKEIKPVDPPKKYVLTLNQNELDLLAALLSHVGGYDGPGGWREISDSMGNSCYKHSTYPTGELALTLFKDAFYIVKEPLVKPKYD